MLYLTLSLSLRFSLYLFLLHRYSTFMDRLPAEGCEAMLSHPCKSYIQKRNIYDERTFQHKPAIAANQKRKKYENIIKNKNKKKIKNVDST